jgi:nucleoid DNA-binding protein
MQINKSDFVSAVHQELCDTLADGNKKAFKKQGVEEVIAATFEVIQKSIANGDKVFWAGFGSFEKSHRQERSARNPKTGEVMNIAAKDVPKFSPAKQFKDRVA